MNGTGVLPVKRERAYSVELWRFIFTIGVALSHFQRLGIARVADLSGVTTLFRTGRFICFFMLVTGFFIMDGFQRRKAANDPLLANPSKAAWGYVKGRYKALWPAFFVGCLFGAILNIISNPDIASFKDVVVYLGQNIYVFAGLETSGITAGVGALNGALWYISAIFVTGLPFYYLLCKNEKAFKIVAPALFLVIIGYFGLAGPQLGMLGMWSKNVLSMGAFETSWLASLGWFCLGSMLWYPVQRLKNADLSKFQLVLINLVEAVLIVLLLKAVVYEGFYRDETLVFAYVSFFFVIMMSGRDIFSKAFNKVKFFGVLGKFSLYMYVMHMPLVSFLPYLFGDRMTGESYYLWLLIFAAVDIVLALIAMLFTDYVLKPLLRVIIGKIKKQPDEEPIEAK